MIIDWNLVIFVLPFFNLGIALIALIVVLLIQKRISKIFKSANAPDIERLLGLHSKTLENLLKFQAQSNLDMQVLDNRIKEKMRSAPTLRFNPFQSGGEVGGNQSFSSVFADEKGDGVIITAMHTRERTNVFAKPLKNWQSQYEFSEEEKTTLNQAKTNGTK